MVNILLCYLFVAKKTNVHFFCGTNLQRMFLRGAHAIIPRFLQLFLLLFHHSFNALPRQKECYTYANKSKKLTCGVHDDLREITDSVYAAAKGIAGQRGSFATQLVAR